jgi:hypothetical protein
VTKGPLLSWLVTRPATNGWCIYKNSDPPPPTLGHFFCPRSTAPPPPSSSLTAASRILSRPHPPRIHHHCRPPGIRRASPSPPTLSAPAPLVRHRRPPERGGILPDRSISRPPSASSPSSYSVPSSPTSEAPPPCHPVGRTIASARASTSSVPPLRYLVLLLSAFILTFVIPNSGKGATFPRPLAYPDPTPNFGVSGLVDANK